MDFGQTRGSSFVGSAQQLAAGLWPANDCTFLHRRALERTLTEATRIFHNRPIVELLSRPSASKSSKSFLATLRVKEPTAVAGRTTPGRSSTRHWHRLEFHQLNAIRRIKSGPRRVPIPADEPRILIICQRIGCACVSWQ